MGDILIHILYVMIGVVIGVGLMCLMIVASGDRRD